MEKLLKNCLFTATLVSILAIFDAAFFRRQLPAKGGVSHLYYAAVDCTYVDCATDDSIFCTRSSLGKSTDL